MNRRFILGSGIVGLLARHILGPGWKIIPFGRSRFYSFNPALANNYFIYHEDLNEIMTSLIQDTKPLYYQRAYSYNGELIFSDESFAKLGYIHKVFGEHAHPAAQLLVRSSSIIYKSTVTSVYDYLMNKYKSEISKSIHEWGNLEKISDHTLKMENGTFEYDYIISTIPLDALYEYVGQYKELPYRDVWYYHVETPRLDFEGASEVLVCDAPYDFYRVDRVGRIEYVFHCLKDLGNPYKYLGAFTNNDIKIIAHTSMKKAFPIGVPPSTKDLEDKHIYPVGAHAQWDVFMDISSCIKRLIKLNLNE
ncbi:MAG: hypothetical protein QXP41_00565 [Candidatus Nitrosocaldus sp.]